MSCSAGLPRSADGRRYVGRRRAGGLRQRIKAPPATSTSSSSSSRIIGPSGIIKQRRERESVDQANPTTAHC